MNKVIVGAAVAVIAATSAGLGVMWQKRVSKKERVADVGPLERKVGELKKFIDTADQLHPSTEKCRKALGDAITYISDYVGIGGAVMYSVALDHLEEAEGFAADLQKVKQEA